MSNSAPMSRERLEEIQARYANKAYVQQAIASMARGMANEIMVGRQVLPNQKWTNITEV
jgi:hypothetical protein